jgi:hypothetical protein
MTAIAGLRGTGDWGADERPKNFRELILWRNPNGSAPLTAMMARMKTERTDDPEFSWWEEAMAPVRVTVDGTGAAAASTALGLTVGALHLVPGDVLLVEKAETTNYDNEIVVVSSVGSDTAIVIKRAQAGTTAAGIAAAANLTKIGNVYGEGTDSPDATTRNPTKLKNYAQIFKTAYELTETAKNTRARTGDPLKNDKKRKMFDHSTALEYAWMFGKAHETVGPNGKPMRFSGGLREFIKTNVTVFATTPTEDTFLNAIYKVFDYEGSGAGNERMILAGNGFLNSLNKLAKNSNSTRLNFDGVVKTYGMSLQRWITPQGEFYVRTHPLMNVHDRFTNSAFVIDPSGIIYRPMRDTKTQDGIQAPDSDTHKGQWLTEAGIEVHHEGTMAYLGNFVV